MEADFTRSHGRADRVRHLSEAAPESPTRPQGAPPRCLRCRPPAEAEDGLDALDRRARADFDGEGGGGCRCLSA